MSYEAITYDFDERVAVLTFNRPDKLNAFNQTMKNEVRDAIAAFSADEERRVLVITGAGGRAFSAGYDLKEAGGQARTDLSVWRARMADDFSFTRAPWDCGKPVIAMIEGHCLAGALEFAQMCDIRYCSEGSTFGVVETRFSAGVVTLAMPWIIGARAREMILSGDTIGAEEARQIGLVNRVFAKSELRAETMKRAKRMSQVAMACLQWNKRAINQTYETMGFSTAMQYGVEACTILDSTVTPEYQEFSNRRRDEGLAAAIRWRDEQFRRYE
ncbi:MAG: enoyl-CoA hydratase/isomerase family protein [Acidisphaera sp.]|nr:enoyl-CoA hydratase/isomerase family protein [Acidisphaera sp.]